MKAIWNDEITAQSDDTVIVEGNHYFPLSSINPSFLTRSDKTSFCPWKGTANYHTLIVGGIENKDAAWFYETPKDAAKQIAGRVSFWRGVQLTQ